MTCLSPIYERSEGIVKSKLSGKDVLHYMNRLLKSIMVWKPIEYISSKLELGHAYREQLTNMTQSKSNSSFGVQGCTCIHHPASNKGDARGLALNRFPSLDSPSLGSPTLGTFCRFEF